jgi:hypothetical protein
MILISKTIKSIGCLSFVASPLAALLQPMELWAPATAYMTRILDTGTTFVEENNGVWQLIE